MSIAVCSDSGRETLGSRCGAGREHGVRRRGGRGHGKRGSGNNEGNEDHA